MIVNVAKVYEKAVPKPAANATTQDPSKAGTRPYLSATKPHRIPPTIEPQKNID